LDTIETYEQWLAARRYSVVRNTRKGSRSEDVIITSGLRLEQAREMSERLNGQEWASSPGETSWTLGLHMIQLDTPSWVPVHQQLATQKG
jgi:hypothetical protein